jgi:hypothetical protein
MALTDAIMPTMETGVLGFSSASAAEEVLVKDAMSGRKRSSGWPERKMPASSFSLLNFSRSVQSSSGGRGISLTLLDAASPPIMSKRDVCPDSRGRRVSAPIWRLFHDMEQLGTVTLERVHRAREDQAFDCARAGLGAVHPFAKVEEVGEWPALFTLLDDV